MRPSCDARAACLLVAQVSPRRADTRLVPPSRPLRATLAEMQQQQIAALAQQSMMGGALSAAMQDEGFMNKAGGAAGNFMGKMMGMR